ncbi:MAG: 30S ribosomal protein S28e [DPANN group archaeon]|nr:30S ribosomal protein S28e [DPANN group archaeon]
MAKPSKKSNAETNVEESGPFPARVMEIAGSMGTREGGKQVRVKVLAGRDNGKIIRRNVLGPIKIGDILMLNETEIEASPLKGRKR